MRRSLVAILISVVTMLSCLLVPAVVAYASEGSSDVLVVGVPRDRCPVFYEESKTNEVVGIGTDLMRAAAEEAGYSVKFRTVKEKTLKDALDNEEYDLVMPFGSAIDSAKGKHSVVSENLLQTPFTLVTVGRQNMQAMTDLTVGMHSSLGGGAETVKRLFPGMKIEFFDSMDDAVKALRAEKVDALLHNSYVWSYLLQKPAYKDLTVLPEKMFSMDFRAGTLDTADGRALISRLNAGIDKLTDTRRQAIILDYTSRRLYQYDLNDYIYEYWVVLLLLGLLVIALIIITVQKIHAVHKEQEERMRWLVDHDQLTGALSMDGFRKRVKELLHDNPQETYLISYNNIKNFKYINDSFGMAAGDDLLRFWVDQSKKVLTDKDAIGRVSSDHFVALRHTDGEAGMELDERMVFDKLRTFFINQGKDYRVQVSSGIYMVTPDDIDHVDVDRMLDFARVAERRVRDMRKDGYEFYNPEEWKKGKLVADVVSHLPVAVANKELQVYYQPQIDYATGEITGAEALCRWEHERLGCIAPSEFIPVLEKANLIYDMDSFIWDRVCQDLKRWNDQGIRRSVSVNVSRRDVIEDRDIPGHFLGLIKQYELSPDQLRIEITESAYAEDDSLLEETTNRLRELGFRVEMDDFGSGYSSLHMLKEVQIDRIKLDMHFLTKKGDPQKGRIIVSQIIKMIKSLGMDLIAEGVETAEQASFLMRQGCSEMQGFYFYKPMPVKKFEKL